MFMPLGDGELDLELKLELHDLFLLGEDDLDVHRDVSCSYC